VPENYHRLKRDRIKVPHHASQRANEGSSVYTGQRRRAGDVVASAQAAGASKLGGISMGGSRCPKIKQI